MDIHNLAQTLLKHVVADLVWNAYIDAPGDELTSGKFASPESSAALVANTFGPFLDKPERLPRLSKVGSKERAATLVQLEQTVRFPWAGGRHPCLDVLITLEDGVIGVESKRYEPYRAKSEIELSDAYWRPVWGDKMRGYEQIRDLIRDRKSTFEHLDVAQLVKHAFGLRTLVNTETAAPSKHAVLYYLFAEPRCWPDGRPLSPVDVQKHRDEIVQFSALVANNEVEFIWSSYWELLSTWYTEGDQFIREHVGAVLARFTP